MKVEIELNYDPNDCLIHHFFLIMYEPSSKVQVCIPVSSSNFLLLLNTDGDKLITKTSMMGADIEITESDAFKIVSSYIQTSSYDRNS